MVELDLLNTQTVRDQCIGHIEVLERVKELLLLPRLDCYTMKQVAEWYEVDVEAVKKTYQRNRSEFESDGATKVSVSEFAEKLDWDKMSQSNRGTKTFTIDGVSVTIPNVGVILFPRRAILRVGMLLRDSRVAQEVRTQLLNICDALPAPAQTVEIENEIDLYTNFARALVEGTPEDTIRAFKEVVAFKDRHIAAMQTSNRILANEILTWSDRSHLNRAVRVLSAKSHVPEVFIWSGLYSELKYKHRINLKKRGPAPYVQYIKDKEWPVVQKTFAAMCEAEGYEPSEIMEEKSFAQRAAEWEEKKKIQESSEEENS